MVTSESRLLFVGAHIGTLVIPLAKAVREVVAVEANPATFATLELNLLLNGCNNVRALNVAASDKAGHLSFLASRFNSGGSKILPVKTRFEFVYDHPDTIDVPAARLDELLADFSPTHVIMDIEGSEVPAIQGMPRLLLSADVLVVECLGNHLENVAGISCAEFIKLLPFEKIRLLDEPERNIVQAVESDPYRAFDLVCSHQ
jgi:FkbM family methyltransferase